MNKCFFNKCTLNLFHENVHIVSKNILYYRINRECAFTEEFKNGPKRVQFDAFEKTYEKPYVDRKIKEFLTHTQTTSCYKTITLQLP